MKLAKLPWSNLNLQKALLGLPLEESLDGGNKS